MTYKKKIIFLVAIFFALFILTACNISNTKAGDYNPRTRTYYIAAEDVEWDYAPESKDLSEEKLEEKVWLTQTKYDKTRFIEYTDDTFAVKKEQPAWLGILGPIIRGVPGDTIKVVFLNQANKTYSIHPHGLLYTPENEGVVRDDVGGKDMAAPGERYTYTWQVTEDAAPSLNEGGSKVWLYHSHVDAVSDIYEGLMGPIIITSRASANEDGTPRDVDKEFVTLFLIFDESEEGMSDEEKEGHLKHAINGYIFDTLPGLEMKKGDKVRWHLLGLGTEVDLHTPHWHGETVSVRGQYTTG